ncbi:hypothetical protein K443DRAFT_192667 [Laccaria amethystina LaAM-08-1]|uniref:Uncharacterized protein n=1 Tax=Laccaria amethystina LaAM-08-1 TaxID=1095629 RepID=A0A0C9WVY7_9AGAR|nr:hypothetical protein K443DRAFT_192667 [Laccaria amethystina LaAM-08-1]
MVDMMGTSQFLKSFGLGLSTVPEDFEDHEGRVMDTLCALMGAPDVNPRRLPFQEQHFVDFLTDAFYGVAPLSQGDPDPRRLVARFFFSGHISDNVIAFAAATWLYRGIQLLSEKNTDLSGYGDLPNFTIHYIFAVMRGRVQVLAEDEDFAQFKQRIDSLPP